MPFALKLKQIVLNFEKKYFIIIFLSILNSPEKFDVRGYEGKDKCPAIN
jgi:hypothetical protein